MFPFRIGNVVIEYRDRQGHWQVWARGFRWIDAMMLCWEVNKEQGAQLCRIRGE